MNAHLKEKWEGKQVQNFDDETGVCLTSNLNNLFGERHCASF